MIAQQPSATAIAGVAFASQPVVMEEDAFGNVVIGDSTTMVTATRGSVGTASLQGTNLTVTLSDGIATFTGLSYDLAQAMNIHFAANLGGVASISSNNVAVSPNAPAHLVLTTQPSSTATAGTTIATQPVVAEEDAFGNVITTDSTSMVTVAAGSLGTATLQGGPLTVTLTDGVAAFGGLFYDKAETMNLGFTDSNGSVTPATSNSIVVSPNTATQIVFGQQPANGIAGDAIAPAVTVLIEDNFGNVETGDDASTLSLAVMTGPGTIAGGGTATVSAGVATFTNLTLDTAGAYTLQASDASPLLTSAASNSFSITANGAEQLAFEQQPTSTTAGAASARR